MTNGNVINNDNTETGDPVTVVPIPSAVVPTIVAFSTDSGIISDHITNDSTLTLTGTAEANSTVKVSDGTTLHVTAAANGTGAWSYATGKLSDNAHSFTATDTDAAGNVSAASSALAVTAAPSHLPVVTASRFYSEPQSWPRLERVAGISCLNITLRLWRRSSRSKPRLPDDYTTNLDPS